MSNYDSATAAAAGIQIRVNGDFQTVPEGSTLVGILRILGIPEDRVAVELNREIVRKPDWESSVVGAGSELEIVHFVGGG